MVKKILSELIEAKGFDQFTEFATLMNNPSLKTRFSIIKNEEPYPIGSDKFEFSACFFFYDDQYLVKTFMCKISGDTTALANKNINCFPYPCNDFGRSEDWEWVDVN
jgi:hypothetical protein